MFGIGLPEMLVILVVALIVLGPKRLPEVARQLGKAVGEFRRQTSDLMDDFSTQLRLDDDAEHRRRAQQAAAAATAASAAPVPGAVASKAAAPAPAAPAADTTAAAPAAGAADEPTAAAGTPSSGTTPGAATRS